TEPCRRLPLTSTSVRSGFWPRRDAERVAAPPTTAARPRGQLMEGESRQRLSCNVTAPPCSGSPRESRSTKLALSRACVARRLPRTTISSCPGLAAASAPAGGAVWAEAPEARTSAPSAAPYLMVVRSIPCSLIWAKLRSCSQQGLRRLVLLIDSVGPANSVGAGTAKG